MKASEISSKDYFFEPFISEGYRASTKDMSVCVQSLFWLHNQWTNIWSSLLPFFLCVTELVNVLRGPSDYHIDTEFKIIFSIYLFCLSMGFLSSAIYHTFHCHEDLRHKTLLWDLIGIYVSGCGSCLPLIYFGFYEFPYLQNTYLAINLGNGMLGIFLTHTNLFRASQMLRTQIIGVTSLSGIWFTVHLYYLLDQDIFWRLAHPVAMYYLFFSVGVFFYLSRLPERLYPGSCVHFQSHFLWHVFICLGVIYLLYGNLEFWFSTQRPHLIYLMSLAKIE